MFMNHYIKEKMNIKPFKFKLAIALENLKKKICVHIQHIHSGTLPTLNLHTHLHT